ncbi:Com family DNA-binding transcriptional regulator [Halothermothrix orenii]
MKQYRCKNCNRRLFDEELIKGKIKIKCPRCGQINILKRGTD